MVICLGGTSVKSLKSAGHGVYCSADSLRVVKTFASQDQHVEWPRGNVLYQQLKNTAAQDLKNEAMKVLRRTWFEDARSVGGQARMIE